LNGDVERRIADSTICRNFVSARDERHRFEADVRHADTSWLHGTW
jgi:hypothetical protein